MSDGGFLSRLFGWKAVGTLDERFVLHRYKSTRFAVLVGMIVLFALFTYDAVAHEIIRWDLFGISGSIALAKVFAMLYYRRTN